MENNDFESRLAQAKAILEKLMNPELTLEQSVKAYEEGTNALKDAQKMLEAAKKQVERIRSGDGEPS